ncbi:sulfurtransferase complex subunit TusB [Photobacterium sp. NCIMB 13483]|uniref:Protein TusB n=1 Tax=Photobacterium piscicola TaxID=1378299 RepID=A0A1T5I3V2_9GAMM|nr:MULTISPECIES: sulfurtransferase complex subunit TusB [Photobacterium]MEC6824818.1 sulfurtransferase complex subunit TusB [Photobacterium piscicola]MEC6883403.1 sulfurtransferase complex subunit TusB [Photobacterium piscicola]MEC6899350.1 sulfurtransferase complex subunit TusB [Photobacterium piscicola]PST93072.1 sulfurtransferase complex subunit TusB [Photobacterium sp. NCIMB 13483]SKC33788.1 Protein TusB [Photobacterium piscicola]
MLHTVTRSPFQSHSLAQCLQFICAGDEILLLEDAVIVALSENIYFDLIKNIGVKIYLLEADIIARGLQDKCDKDLDVIDYKGFVLLTERHDKHMKWA